jgi:glycosyltransferase involved in cell wall biosynthesis
MKLFGICLIKNEADIIAYSLTKHSVWADLIFVYDNGSTDGTWEIVLELAKTNPKIIPFKQEAKPFRDGLRAEVFNTFKHLASDGDWWCIRCDSDEFYIDDPRVILPQISRFHQVVTSLHYEYYLTQEELPTYQFNKPTEELLNQIHYYHPKVTSETRFIKHRSRLVWPETDGFPKRKGIVSPIKIRLKHFQFRTPEQIEARMKVRKQARADGYKYFVKDVVETWKELVLPQGELIKESPEMRYGWVKDPNHIPWYLYTYRFIMHALKIYP